MNVKMLSTQNGDHPNLYTEVRNILLSARTNARRAINETMVDAYWQVGRLIVEEEQKGNERAQ